MVKVTPPKKPRNVIFRRYRKLPNGTVPTLLRSSAAPRGGLTPAEAPLIDAEFLFRQPEPAHWTRSTTV
jgi:hypothetical protein